MTEKRGTRFWKRMIARCAGTAATGLAVLLPGIVMGAWSSGPPAAAWTKDATRVSLPAQKVTGSLAGSALTVQRVVWHRQTEMPFSDAPLEVMALELHGRTAKPHRMSALASGRELSDMPKEVRAQILAASKKAGPNTAAFVVTVSLRKGDSIAGKEFVHRVTDSMGNPTEAEPGKPVLVGAEVRLDEMSSVSTAYTLRLRFGPRRGAVQPGTVYLCLEDGKKSFVAGTFEAVVK